MTEESGGRAIASAPFDDLDVKLENTSHEAAGLAPRKGL